VSEIIFDGVWNHPPTLLVNEVTDGLDTIVLPRVPLPNTLVWSHSVDGKLTSKNAVAFLRPRTPYLPWADLIWKGCIPPSHSFTFWWLMHRKMPTDENLWTRGCVTVFVCCFCLTINESSKHLFLQCPFATEPWTWLGGKLNCLIDCVSVHYLLSCIPA
jgi:hypothetical protein